MNIQTAPVSFYEKKIKLLTVFLCVLFLSFATVIGLFVLSTHNGKFIKVAESFEVSDVRPEVIEQLDGHVVFTGANRSAEQLYYSSLFQLTFKYNANVMSVSDYTKSVGITPHNMQNSGYLYLLNEKVDINSYIEKEYSDVDEFVLEEEKVDRDVKISLFKYKEVSLLNNTKHKDVYMSVFSRVIDDSKTVYIEVRDFDHRSNNITNNFISVLETISFDLTNVSKEAKVILEDGSVSVLYDQNVWKNSYVSDALAIFKVNDPNYEYGDTDLKIATEQLYSNWLEAQENKEDVAGTKLREKVSDFKNFYKDKEIKVLHENQNFPISNANFKQSCYEFKQFSSFEELTTKCFSVAFLKDSEKFVVIESSYSDKNSQVANLFNDFYKNIEIVEKKLYALNPNGIVLGTSSVVLNTSTILAQAAVVRVAVGDCAKATFASDLAISGSLIPLAGKSYKICADLLGYGSAFAIDGNGHFVTNAHVANSDPKDAFAAGLLYYEKNIEYFQDLASTAVLLLLRERSQLAEYIDEQSDEGSASRQFSLRAEFAKSEVIRNKLAESSLANQFSAKDLQNMMERLHLVFLNDEEGEVVVLERGDSSDKMLYIQGSEQFKINKSSYFIENIDQHIKAEFVNGYNDYKVYVDEENPNVVLEPDLALIKSTATFNYPSLLSSSRNIISGDNIFAVGYPGIMGEGAYGVFSKDTLADSTVTSGIVSTIRDSYNSSFKVLAFDAAIAGGNSGGPVINSAGDFVGVATWGFVSRNEPIYSGGVHYSAVIDMLAKNNISNTLNKERVLLESALKNIEKSYYKLAQEDLIKLKQSNSNIGGVVNPLVALADSKIADGADKTPIFVTDSLILPNWALFLSIGLLVILVVVMVFIVVLLRRKNNSNSTNQDSVGENGGSQTPVVPMGSNSTGVKGLPASSVSSVSDVDSSEVYQQPQIVPDGMQQPPVLVSVPVQTAEQSNVVQQPVNVVNNTQQ